MKRPNLLNYLLAVFFAILTSGAAWADSDTVSLIAQNKAAVVAIQAKRALFIATPLSPKDKGSGFLVAPNLVVTANHVVQGAKDIKVITTDDQKFDAKVVESWPSEDMALLQLDGVAQAVIGVNPVVPPEGSTLVAMGYPFGFNLFSSAGILSSARSGSSMFKKDLIATDAVVNPGMSGGALIGPDGQLAGLITQIYTTTDSFAGMTFALPSSKVSELLRGWQVKQSANR